MPCVKSFVWQLVYASKSTFYFIQIVVETKLGIKISDQIKGGGSENGQKSATYYLNGPL
jgi:hypothetical protein